jgi:hypothetical protein
MSDDHDSHRHDQGEKKRGIPEVGDTLEILAFQGALLRDAEGRLWLALHDTGPEGGGRMPHLVAADTVRVSHVEDDGLDVIKDPAPGSGEFAASLRAFRLKGDLREDVERLLGD